MRKLEMRLIGLGLLLLTVIAGSCQQQAVAGVVPAVVVIPAAVVIPA